MPRVTSGQHNRTANKQLVIRSIADGAEVASKRLMTDAQRTWSIELLLLEDGSVSIRADDGEPLAHGLRRVEQNPAAVVRVVDEWLEHHEDGSITVVLRSAQAPIAVWTSCCASLALYRMASMLGNDWMPDFELSDPPADAASDEMASTGVRIRVPAMSEAASS